MGFTKKIIKILNQEKIDFINVVNIATSPEIQINFGEEDDYITFSRKHSSKRLTLENIRNIIKSSVSIKELRPRPKFKNKVLNVQDKLYKEEHIIFEIYYPKFTNLLERVYYYPKFKITAIEDEKNHHCYINYSGRDEVGFVTRNPSNSLVSLEFNDLEYLNPI